jgi:hypothetical protein
MDHNIKTATGNQAEMTNERGTAVGLLILLF